MTTGPDSWGWSDKNDQIAGVIHIAINLSPFPEDLVVKDRRLAIWLAAKISGLHYTLTQKDNKIDYWPIILTLVWQIAQAYRMWAGSGLVTGVFSISAPYNSTKPGCCTYIVCEKVLSGGLLGGIPYIHGHACVHATISRRIGNGTAVLYYTPQASWNAQHLCSRGCLPNSYHRTRLASQVIW